MLPPMDAVVISGRDYRMYHGRCFPEGDLEHGWTAWDRRQHGSLDCLVCEGCGGELKPVPPPRRRHPGIEQGRPRMGPKAKRRG